MSKLTIILIASFSIIQKWAHSMNDGTNTGTIRYFYTDNSMKQSVAYKLMQNYEQQELQEEILYVLGLNHKPKPNRYSKDESASKYLMDLYSTYNNEVNDLTPSTIYNSNIPGIHRNNHLDQERLESNIIMSFLNQIKTQRRNKLLRHNRDRRFWFNVTNVPIESQIIDAELRIYRDLKRSRLNSSYPLQLTIYQLFRGFSNGEVIMNYVDSMKIHGDVQGWLHFNVTSPLNEWIKFPAQNLGLYLQIHSTDIAKELSPKSIGLINARGFKKYQPFMAAYIKSYDEELKTPPSPRVQKSRSRRATANRKRSDATYYDPDDRNPFLNSNDRYISKSCQKRTLFVSFRDLNWQDWIIAPDGYSAFYCHGDCSFPMNSKMNATNHAVVQHLFHIKNRYVPKPCCAPAELSSIMVLYFDDNSNVVLKKFKNMVIQSCGCH